MRTSLTNKSGHRDTRIKDCVQWSLWQPLSRTSFCARVSMWEREFKSLLRERAREGKVNRESVWEGNRDSEQRNERVREWENERDSERGREWMFCTSLWVGYKSACMLSEIYGAQTGTRERVRKREGGRSVCVVISLRMLNRWKRLGRSNKKSECKDYTERKRELEWKRS